MYQWTSKKMKQLIERVRVAVRNLRRFPELAARLVRFGIDDDRLTEGSIKADNCEALFIGRKTKFGKQLIATKRVIDMIDEVFTYYWDYASMLKIRFRKDKQTLELLGLRGKRVKTVMGLIVQAKQFYQGLIDNPDILALSAADGITQQVIDDGIAKIDTLETENEIQEAAKGDAQNTTQRRNEAFEDLYDYYKLLKNAADREFVDQPQLKEKLEMKEYSPGYVKKKKTEEEPGTEEPQDEPSEQPVNYTEESNQA